MARSYVGLTGRLVDIKTNMVYYHRFVQAMLAQNESEASMRTMTIRNIPDEVTGGVRRSAERHRTSINAAVISLLSESLGLGHPQKKRDLAAFCGGWTAREAAAFESATKRVVDREAWK